MNVTPIRPLICPQTICDLTGKTAAEVAALIESGSIAFAFDIRAPRSARRTIRVYWPAFLDYIEKRKPVDRDLDTVIREIIGQPRDGIALAFFARAIKCGSEHLRNLVKARKLKLLSKPRRGPNGSPKISYQT